MNNKKLESDFKISQTFVFIVKIYYIKYNIKIKKKIIKINQLRSD